MASIIKVENLSYVYNPGMPGATTALENVSFEVEEGDFVGIIGSTGSGKSTLISHMNGLNRPTSGKIYIDGRDIWEDPSKIREFRFMVGLVFQYPEYQLFEETCYKDIAFGPKNMGLDEKEIDRRVHEAARFVGLSEELLQRSPFELSGGQKRRVAIAGVIAMEPSVLILDEPTAGLDPVGGEEILGKGVAIRPASDRVVAPCDATVDLMFDTGHAVSLKADCGAEVLIHVGINTVALKGEGFRALVKEGDQVKKGQTVCILEAMKMMSEIPAPMDCVIEEILVENGSLAGYDAPLFRVRRV